jgi:quercetin dioxygenase-like cupin family protein
VYSVDAQANSATLEGRLEDLDSAMEREAYRVSFDDADGWESPSEGVRIKHAVHGSAKLRLVEMTASATHPEWCEVGHCGCVIEGVLEVELTNRIVRFEAGDGIVIPPGFAHRHRPRAASERVRLTLVDSPE